jgi:hypothetical protein
MDRTYKSHAVKGYSPFGSGETGEFATFRQGREVWDEDIEVRLVALFDS